MERTQIRRLFEPTPRQQLRCRHPLTGCAPESKLCANWYDCKTCEYDQMLEDTAPVQEIVRTPAEAARQAA
ncbi:MAG: hypothetical protein AB1646_10150 [Thermodesulfobacteriota bacterium]